MKKHRWPYYVLLRWTKLSKRDGIIYKYLESKVPNYQLPDPLKTSEENRVSTKEQWRDIRRPEIMKIFQEEVYGKSPERPKSNYFELLEEDKKALGGKATRKQIAIYLLGEKQGPKMDFLVYVPNKTKKMDEKVPLFYGLNFYGNHTASEDPNIIITNSWMRNKAEYGISNHQATEKSRGVRKERWSVEYLVDQGCAIGTIYYGDITPDRPNGVRTGIHSYYEDLKRIPIDQCLKKNKKRKGYEWGAISSWAWGLSRTMDFLEEQYIPEIDLKKICLVGHSRLGKTALWAAAQDRRFNLVCASGSGCLGAALSKRCFGETVELINVRFPHWFAKNFHKYNAKEEKIPVDQHELFALIAPRPAYVASGDSDLWADPLGGYRSLQAASQVYEVMEKDGFKGPKEPQIENPIYSTLGHHVRKGGHDLTQYEWENFVKFAKKHL